MGAFGQSPKSENTLLFLSTTLTVGPRVCWIKGLQLEHEGSPRGRGSGRRSRGGSGRASVANTHEPRLAPLLPRSLALAEQAAAPPLRQSQPPSRSLRGTEWRLRSWRLCYVEAIGTPAAEGIQALLAQRRPWFATCCFLPGACVARECVAWLDARLCLLVGGRAGLGAPCPFPLNPQVDPQAFL